MGLCPVCGAEAAADRTECSGCGLATSLFDAVAEAAGTETDPTYVRTVAELLRSVDLAVPTEVEPLPPWPPSARALLPGNLGLPPSEPLFHPVVLERLSGIPPLPTPVQGEELRHRTEELLRLGRRLGLDLTAIAARVGPAERVDDERSLDAAFRELFVSVASGLTVDFESELARRNEIAQIVPTPSADVELNALRLALGIGDLVGADRRLTHLRDELARLEDRWATGRILLTSCDLLAATISELGGEPSPALGPVREGRRRLADGRSEDGERLLARGALALWTVLEPLFLGELRRLRDRLVELHSAGADVEPALGEMRAISTELRRRNFVGTIVGLRGLRALVTAPGAARNATGGPSEATAVRPSLPP